MQHISSLQDTDEKAMWSADRINVQSKSEGRRNIRIIDEGWYQKDLWKGHDVRKTIQRPRPLL